MAKKRPADKRSVRIRYRKRNVNALNIVINPHPKGRYIELFQSAVDKKVVFAFYGKRSGFVSSFSKARDNLHRGTLALFTDIDLARTWLDFQTGQPATEDDVLKISIPQNLRPEYHSVPFVFDSEMHRMIFVSNGLGVQSARKLISGLLGNPAVVGSDAQLEVTIVQDADKLDAMLNERNIVELTIEINLPNADSLAEVESELFERLQGMKSKKLSQVFEADSSKSLVPDKRAKLLGEVALNNGKVETKVKTEQGMVERSTLDSPKTRKLIYDPQSSAELDALQSMYQSFFKK